MEYSVEQIKDLYCKFTCVYAKKLIKVNELSIDPCDFCQIDNYIQELKDHNFIK